MSDEFDGFKFAKLGFVYKPRPLIARIESGEFKLDDFVALSDRNLDVQMRNNEIMTLKEAWKVHGFIEGKNGGIKITLTRRGNRKDDSTAKYVLFATRPIFEYKIDLNQYRIQTVADAAGRPRRQVSVKNIVPKAFKIIDDVVEANCGLAWPYIMPTTGGNTEFGVTFENELDAVMFTGVLDAYTA